MKTALTIAGSDPTGGAGIQADIKTMLANGVYAMSVVTALVAENTTRVTRIMEVSPEFLGECIHRYPAGRGQGRDGAGGSADHRGCRTVRVLPGGECGCGPRDGGD